MSEIEAEIRRQMLDERDRALNGHLPPPSGAASGIPPASNTGSFDLSPPPIGPSYHALPPPSFPQGSSPYPPHYPPAQYPPHYPAQPNPVPILPPASSHGGSKSAQRKGALGGLGAIGIALAKFWGAIKGLLIGLKFLSLGKYLLTAGSMLLSILAYSALFGWRFGAGVVMLIFLHEMGHALAIKRLGYQVTAMVFLPFMGAYVMRDKAGPPAERAQISIMGPAAGLVAGLACGAVYGMTGSPLWLVLAYLSFYMNLFNLSAIPFLDGGRITILIPPRVLLAGLLATAVINWRFPLCWLLVLFALPQIVEQWRSGTIDPAIKISQRDQQIYTWAYFGLVLLLGFGSITAQSWLWELRHLGSSF
ncbi:MAG: Zn-dependent protease [Chthonomonadaceae bacterium]|nr:Zn-dependent protease [Chthonomonadaceae bacterium]